jgi:hypothetical protein
MCKDDFGVPQTLRRLSGEHPSAAGIRIIQLLVYNRARG